MDKNKEVLITFYRKALTVNKETNPAEVLSSILTDDFVSYGSVDSKGKDGLIGMLSFFWQLIPDLKWEPQELLNDGEKYIVRSKATGTPKGDFMGLSTDGTKSFDIMTIDIHKFFDGKIVTVHHIEDWAIAIKQLKS
jgi:predicted ester cyclase